MMIPSNVRADYQRLGNREATVPRVLYRFMIDAGFRAVLLYRVGRWCRSHRLSLIASLLHRLVFHWCQCTISADADIGPGFVIRHAGDIVIGNNSRAGRNCEIRHGVTFGGNMGRKREGRTQPWIGDEVRVAAGAKILGPIVVGDRVFVGANAVVVSDVPPDSIVGGVPAKVLRRAGQPVPLLEQDGSISITLRQIISRLETAEARLQKLDGGAPPRHEPKSDSQE